MRVTRARRTVAVRPVVTSVAVLLCAAASLGASAAPPVPGDPLTGAGEVMRTVLTWDELTALGAAPPAAPVDDAAFALPAGAAMPRHDFSGALTLADPETSGTFRELRDDRDQTPDGDHGRKHLPPMTIELVQNGSHLIPVAQGLAYTGSPYWNIIVGPGRAWNEHGDHGWTRASLPFALIQRGQNCTHNGVLTFLYDDTGVSNVRYQITAEDCLHLKFDLWGQLAASTPRHAIADADALRREHADEMARRMPTRPVEALLNDFPGAGIVLANFIKDIPSQQHIGVWGIVVNGVNYVSRCPTRTGEYPYCDQMRLPSYSVAKSAFAGVALMRLGALRGPEVYRALITDHLPEHARDSDWTGVTFDHALDMATGHYDDPGYLRDEDTAPERRFLEAESYADKIRFALEAFPRKAAPGTTWVYHTNDTFIVTQAMQQLAGRDLFDLVADDVYRPLHLSRGALTTLRTDNRADGRPFGGWGLFFTTDDIAKLASFLDQGDGTIDGRQVLEASRVREAMFRGDDLGQPIADAANVRVPHTWYYGDGFWGKRMTHAEFPVYPCDFMVSRMGGYGGISVVMMPNGTVFYVWSDNDEFGWYSAVAESNKLIPQCGGTPPPQTSTAARGGAARGGG